METKETKKWTPEVIIQAGKEIVTAVLGLLIVGYALYLAYLTFSYVDDPTKMSEAKDVLLLILGLAGVVIGYYFGRVPADARAVQAAYQHIPVELVVLDQEDFQCPAHVASPSSLWTTSASSMPLTLNSRCSPRR